jgi:hypothetical protein
MVGMLHHAICMLWQGWWQAQGTGGPEVYSSQAACAYTSTQATAGLSLAGVMLHTFLRIHMKVQSNMENIRPQLAKLPPMRGDSRLIFCSSRAHQ